MSAPRIDLPQPGFYRTKLVKGGVWVPATIWIETEFFGPRDDHGKYQRRDVIRCRLGDELVDPLQTWPGLRPIDQAEYLYLMAGRKWAMEHAPHLPEANPRKKVDFNNLHFEF